MSSARPFPAVNGRGEGLAARLVVVMLIIIWMFPMLRGYDYSQSYSLREAISCVYVYLVGVNNSYSK